MDKKTELESVRSLLNRKEARIAAITKDAEKFLSGVKEVSESFKR